MFCSYYVLVHRIFSYQWFLILTRLIWHLNIHRTEAFNYIFNIFICFFYVSINFIKLGHLNLFLNVKCQFFICLRIYCVAYECESVPIFQIFNLFRTQFNQPCLSFCREICDHIIFTGSYNNVFVPVSYFILDFFYKKIKGCG